MLKTFEAQVNSGKNISFCRLKIIHGDKPKLQKLEEKQVNLK